MMDAVEAKDMTEEKVNRESSWTIETLREYLLAIVASNDVKYLERFEASQVAATLAFNAQKTAMETALIAQKLSVDTALQAADRAVAKSEIAADKRFEGLNELRGMVSDQQATFMQRGEATVLFKSIEDKIATAQKTYEERHEAFRSGFEKSHEVLVKEVAMIRETQSSTAGKTAGMGVVAAYVVAGASVILTIIFHFIK